MIPINKKMGIYYFLFLGIAGKAINGNCARSVNKISAKK